MKSTRTIQLATLAFGAALALPAPACSGKLKDRNATVKCGKLQTFSSRLGTVNANEFPLGTLLVINPKTKTGFSFGVIPNLTASDWEDTPAEARFEDSFDGSVDVETSADVPTSVKAELAAQVAGKSTIALTNLVRRTLIDPVGVAQERAMDMIQGTLQANPGSRVAVVSGLSLADSASVSLAQSVSASGDATEVAIEQFRLKVEYTCDDVLQVAGKQTGVFFHSTPVRLTGKNTLAVDASMALSLAEVDLTEAP